jgi:uncharacterized OB-fold protein
VKNFRKPRERSKVLDPIECPHCGDINPPGKQFCGICGRSLTEEAMHQVEDAGAIVRRKLVEDPDAQKIFLELVKKLKK